MRKHRNVFSDASPFRIRILLRIRGQRPSLFGQRNLYRCPWTALLIFPHNGHSVRIPANIPYRRITLNFSKFYLPKTPLLTNHAHFKPIVLSENDRLTFCRLCSEYTAASYQLNAPEDLKTAFNF